MTLSATRTKYNNQSYILQFGPGYMNIVQDNGDGVHTGNPVDTSERREVTQAYHDQVKQDIKTLAGELEVLQNFSGKNSYGDQFEYQGFFHDDDGRDVYGFIDNQIYCSKNGGNYELASLRQLCELQESLQDEIFISKHNVSPEELQEMKEALSGNNAPEGLLESKFVYQDRVAIIDLAILKRDQDREHDFGFDDQKPDFKAPYYIEEITRSIVNNSKRHSISREDSIKLIYESEKSKASINEIVEQNNDSSYGTAKIFSQSKEGQSALIRNGKVGHYRSNSIIDDTSPSTLPRNVNATRLMREKQAEIT